MEFEYEKFYAEIIDFNGVGRISIPKQILEGAGWKPGDKIKILAKKIEKEDN